jgi:hypothetical protein
MLAEWLALEQRAQHFARCAWAELECLAGDALAAPDAVGAGAGAGAGARERMRARLEEWIVALDACIEQLQSPSGGEWAACDLVARTDEFCLPEDVVATVKVLVQQAAESKAWDKDPELAAMVVRRASLVVWAGTSNSRAYELHVRDMSAEHAGDAGDALGRAYAILSRALIRHQIALRAAAQACKKARTHYLSVVPLQKS